MPQPAASPQPPPVVTIVDHPLVRHKLSLMRAQDTSTSKFRQLMREIQNEAARLGYRKLIGRMLADNHDGLRLCQATGWHVVGTYQAHARHGARLRDVVLVEYAVPAFLAAE